MLSAEHMHFRQRLGDRKSRLRPLLIGYPKLETVELGCANETGLKSFTGMACAL